jgi:hypothetical protein
MHTSWYAEMATFPMLTDHDLYLKPIRFDSERWIDPDLQRIHTVLEGYKNVPEHAVSLLCTNFDSTVDLCRSLILDRI